MPIPGDVDVLVVGAGPTGLMLANQLVRHGVRTLIVDGNDGPSVRTKALGVQARTLEIYSHLGICERAVELGTRVAGTMAPGDIPKGAPHAGDRFPWVRLQLDAESPAVDLFARLDDTRFHLIVFGQPSDSCSLPGFGDLVVVHRVPDGPVNDRECARARIPRPSFYLLRPDGHVGLAGLRPDSAVLNRYLSDRLALREERGKPPLPRKAA
jgi:hypothetical protein